MLLEELNKTVKMTHELLFRHDFYRADNNLNTLPNEFDNFINILFIKAELLLAIENWNELARLIPNLEEHINDFESRVSELNIHFDEDEKRYISEILAN